jgi:hypothetical protein
VRQLLDGSTRTPSAALSGLDSARPAAQVARGQHPTAYAVAGFAARPATAAVSVVAVLTLGWVVCLTATAVVSAAEFNKITSKTAIGFILMGFIGFFVKLIFIVS